VSSCSSRGSPSARSSGRDDARERVGCDVAGDLRVLLEAAQRVRVPLAAERHVDAQPVAVGYEAPPEVLAHAEEHLELVLARLEAALRDHPSPLVDEPLVVRRDPDVGARVEELAQRLDEVGANGLEVAERDLGRLDVDPLAEPHVRRQVGEAVDVVHRPPHVRLEDDAEVVVTGLAELAVEPQRVVGAARVLHVDAHEVPARGGVADDALEVRAADVVVELEPERGQLDADVRVEAAVLDVGEDVLVGAHDRGGVGLARDLLAEDVDRRHLPLAVQPADGLARVLELGAGDVALREPLDDGLWDRRQQTDDRAVENGHERPDCRAGAATGARA
jgi:hypothetical protein